MRTSDGATSRLTVERSSAPVCAAASGSTRQLAQPALAAQLAAQAAQRMPARHLVAAVRADDEQRLRLERGREHGEHVERAVVGPLQVVEEDGGRPLGRGRREGRDHPVAQGRAIEVRGAAQLGQGGGQRPVGGRAALQPGALEHRKLRFPQRAAGQDGLADAGLAGKEHQRAAARAYLRGRREQLAALVLAPDQHAVSS